jgi:RNA polymerase sigma factor (TIGR02999 family)
MRRKLSFPPHEITHLLAEWSDGNQEALDRLYPPVYDEMRVMARRYMSKERQGQTLQTTALIHQAYLRLIDQREVRWANRAHFFAIAAQIMRRILIDYARRYEYKKRGAGAQRVSLDETAVVVKERAKELLALDDALERLAQIDARRARVVELRFFGGLENEEIGHVLGISANTVVRDWNMARAWLYKELEGSSS